MHFTIPKNILFDLYVFTATTVSYYRIYNDDITTLPIDNSKNNSRKKRERKREKN